MASCLASRPFDWLSHDTAPWKRQARRSYPLLGSAKKKNSRDVWLRAGDGYLTIDTLTKLCCFVAAQPAQSGHRGAGGECLPFPAAEPPHNDIMAHSVCPFGGACAIGGNSATGHYSRAARAQRRWRPRGRRKPCNGRGAEAA